MATHPLALTLPLDDPARTAAQGIADRLSEGCPVARNDLLAEMTSAFGGSSADGLWSLRDAYDVLELAQVLHLKNATLPADANARLAQLIAMTAALAPSRDHAIATALSMYNTGDRQRGFRNGYVARVYASASTVIPLIRGRLPAPVMLARAPLADAAIANPQPETLVAMQAVGWNTAANARQASLMVFGDGAASQKGQHP